MNGTKLFSQQESLSYLSDNTKKLREILKLSSP
ncbi:MAG: hypothetical protein ACI95C_000300 [Pseudohongiellaceae bacterium]